MPDFSTFKWSGFSGQGQRNMTEGDDKFFGIEKLNVPRLEIPSVTHVDYSARIQTVHTETNLVLTL